MAKKKLLNEKQVRRFMGLAGIRPLNEAGMYEDEPAADKEELGAGAPMGDEMGDAGELGDELGDEAGAEMPDEMDAEMGAEEGGEVELTSQDVEKLRALVVGAEEVVGKLEGAAGTEDADLGEPVDDVVDDAGEEADDELDAAPVDDEGDEEAMGDKGGMEALRGVNLELSEDEVVQEVAKRVAKRILKAKQAQARLDEALGNKRARKTPSRTRRSRRTRK